MRLRHPIVDGNRGSYYLGCTAPDIRIFIDASREDTHFLSLDSEEGESGVERMFEAHPELADAANLSDATKCFVAGYLSHLVTDEAWIHRIYRPFFGRSSPLGGVPAANLLDRALQFELDRWERLNKENMSTIRADLSGSPPRVEVNFIESASLDRWREFVVVATTRRSSWEDFRHFAERYLVRMREIAPEDWDTFFSSFDSRREEALNIVPDWRLREFREHSVTDSVKVAREYLG